MTADEILGCTASHASRIFSGDEAAISAAFRRLAAAWHPDRNGDPRATKVLQHLTMLRSEALKRSSLDHLIIADATGARIRMNVAVRHPFDAGEVLVGRSASVAYVIAPAHADLAADSEKRTFSYSSAGMEAEMSRFVPRLLRKGHVERSPVLVYPRTSDQVLLVDLLAACGGKLPPVHVAWMISSLCNLACYLSWAGLMHGAIAPEVLLISPLHHSVALTGPLLYATTFGQRPKALPRRTLDLTPRLALKGELAGSRTDLEAIRLTARQALGDPAGTRLLQDPEVPRALALWLLTPPATSAVADYEGWERAREAAFGPRRFVEMQFSAQGLYGA